MDEKEKNRMTLVDESIDSSWSLVKMAKERPPIGWEDLFHQEDVLLELKSLDRKLSKMSPYYPKKKNVFKAFELTPFESINVVILGQDPYHTTQKNGKPVAQGYSFGCDPYDKIPASLNSMLKELSSDLKIPISTSGDIRYWAIQGVFLPNMCLTVDPKGKGKSHGKIWKGFMLKVFDRILEVNPDVVFVLLGRTAQSIKNDLRTSFYSIEATHPSPISASRGFYNSKIYSKVNDRLTALGKNPIDWAL
uniref:Uracil-DNA glycosylase n=1 Tax=Pithovirus LCPAC403 TaxID=2506596 RepID=A0A481ZBN8_9VIRU|nr:MAG: uracil-DNA glycosylase [Pithovirus LCPAC403]